MPTPLARAKASWSLPPRGAWITPSTTAMSLNWMAESFAFLKRRRRAAPDPGLAPGPVGPGRVPGQGAGPGPAPGPEATRDLSLAPGPSRPTRTAARMETAALNPGRGLNPSPNLDQSLDPNPGPSLGPDPSPGMIKGPDQSSCIMREIIVISLTITNNLCNRKF